MSAICWLSFFAASQGIYTIDSGGVRQYNPNLTHCVPGQCCPAAGGRGIIAPCSRVAARSPRPFNVLVGAPCWILFVVFVMSLVLECLGCQVRFAPADFREVVWLCLLVVSGSPCCDVLAQARRQPAVPVKSENVASYMIRRGGGREV